jgi:pimeloyl-ACP methyl ester carboxylesterase
MSTLLDRKRPSLVRPSRVLVASAARYATAVTWRLAHPRLREPYVESPKPAPLARLYVDTVDGWQLPIHLAPHLPGRSGEPIILSAGLGFGPDLFRYGHSASLVQRLQNAGFQVYLFCHRGNAGAISPRKKGLEVDFDVIVERDVPAALERVLEHSGAEKALWVGYGLGGQLGLAWCGRRQSESIAALAAMESPIYFEGGETTVRKRAVLSRLMPGSWKLPTQGAARLVAAAAGGERWCDAAFGRGAAMPRVRGALEYASEDVALGLVAQGLEWLRHERLVSRYGLLDYTETLFRANAPLYIMEERGRLRFSAARAWTESMVDTVELEPGAGGLAALLGEESTDTALNPLLGWLERQRSRCWLPSASACSSLATG